MKLEVTRGIECGERGYGDESGHCRVCGDENGYGSGECGDECGDGHAKGTSPAGIPLPLPHPSPHPIPNQSKPIVPTPSLSLL
jgi:hypothetical protein